MEKTLTIIGVYFSIADNQLPAITGRLRGKKNLPSTRRAQKKDPAAFERQPGHIFSV